MGLSDARLLLQWSVEELAGVNSYTIESSLARSQSHISDRVPGLFKVFESSRVRTLATL